jgi:hypothetical protein
VITIKVNKKQFKFRYLPDYAAFLLKNKLEEFVTVGIRFAREVDLPMLKPLAKIPEPELVKLSIESNREVLAALVEGHIAENIEQNLRNWIENKLEIIDKNEIAAEDLTLAYFVRRKLFAHFLFSYTQNTVLHQQIIAEVDVYTSYEEVESLRIYLALQKELETR